MTKADPSGWLVARNVVDLALPHGEFGFAYLTLDALQSSMPGVGSIGHASCSHEVPRPQAAGANPHDTRLRRILGLPSP